MEMMNAPGMGYAATRIVGVLFDRARHQKRHYLGRGQCDSGRRRSHIDRRPGRELTMKRFPNLATSDRLKNNTLIPLSTSVPVLSAGRRRIAPPA